MKEEKEITAAGGEELTLEEAFGRLDETIETLQKRDISLEDAFAAYEEGVRLVKLCSGKIDLVEKKVMELRREGETIEFE